MESKIHQHEIEGVNYFTFYFIDYNNHHEKIYHTFFIDAQYQDIDWRAFINNIPATRFTGCTPMHFQSALWDKGMRYIKMGMMYASDYDSYMNVEFNRVNSITVEHQNIGNY